MSDALKLSEAIKQLNASVTETILYFDKLDKNDLPTLVKSFKKLKDDCEELTEIVKLVSTLHQQMSYDILPEAFENHGFDSLKMGGYNFILGVRTNASIPMDKRDVGYAWLRENGLGEIIIPNVNAKTLTSAIKEYMDTNGLVPPESVMTIHNQRYIQVRKS